MTRAPTPLIVPPGSIPATTPPGTRGRAIVVPPGIQRPPQPQNSAGSPGLGPGFALADHRHPFGTGVPGAVPGGGGTPTLDKAVLSDGTKNFIAHGSALALSAGAGAATIECWYKTTSNAAPYLVSYGDHVGGGHIFDLIFDATHLTVAYNGFVDFAQAVIPSSNDGVFHHLVVTWDGSVFKFYVDGSQYTTTHVPTNPPNVTLDQIDIGGYVQENVATPIGTLDELAIYTYALSAGRIATHRAAQNTGLYVNDVISDGPQYYYRFEEAPGSSTCIDSMGVNNLTYNAAGGFTLGVAGAVQVFPQVSGAPGAAAGAGAPTPAVAGNNQNGTVNFGTGAGPAAGEQVVVSYSQTFNSSPNVQLTPLNAATSALGVFLSSRSGSSFGIGFSSPPAANQPVGTYRVGYSTTAPTP